MSLTVTDNSDIAILDLDGTIALTHHRDYLIRDKSKRSKEAWELFYDLCYKDEPNIAVIRSMNAWISANKDIRIFTGRSARVREKTHDWLFAHTDLLHSDIDRVLRMRPEGDNTEDTILKRRWFFEMPEEERKRVVCVYDDRTRVVEMWRALGLTCFQVAQNDF